MEGNKATGGKSGWIRWYLMVLNNPRQSDRKIGADKKITKPYTSTNEADIQARNNRYYKSVNRRQGEV